MNTKIITPDPTLTPEQRAKRIKVVVFDVDGVMTNGGLGLDDAGLEFKTFHAHDGLGLKMLHKSGVKMAIITARNSNTVNKRGENTKMDKVYQGAEDKLEAFYQLLQDFNIQAEECAYMGDDVVDLPAMRRCGFAVTVPQCTPLVRQYAHYVTRRDAGFGAVRELCELIMQAQGTFDAQMAVYLK